MEARWEVEGVSVAHSSQGGGCLGTLHAATCWHHPATGDPGPRGYMAEGLWGPRVSEAYDFKDGAPWGWPRRAMCVNCSPRTLSGLTEATLKT